MSTGWQCESWIAQTLESVEEQSVDDWRIQIVYDPSTDAGADLIQAWCEDRDARWRCAINTEQRFAVRNQVEAVQALDPANTDIIVWLDLDGDRFAHPEVLAHLADAYADGTTLLTYGSYRPEPDKGTSTMATPFPPDVVAANSYRHQTRHVHCHFNHLRSMSGKLFWSIPDDQYHWPDGRWYAAGADYILMIAGLELAGGRYKCLTEELMIYNHANPLSDNLVRVDDCTANIVHFLERPPLDPLP
ncbi:MAG: glycosyltransferase [Pseudomonadota bacterium]